MPGVINFAPSPEQTHTLNTLEGFKEELERLVLTESAQTIAQNGREERKNQRISDSFIILTNLEIQMRECLEKIDAEREMNFSNKDFSLRTSTRVHSDSYFATHLRELVNDIERNVYQIEREIKAILKEHLRLIHPTIEKAALEKVVRQDPVKAKATLKKFANQYRKATLEILQKKYTQLERISRFRSLVRGFVYNCCRETNNGRDRKQNPEEGNLGNRDSFGRRPIGWGFGRFGQKYTFQNHNRSPSPVFGTKDSSPENTPRTLQSVIEDLTNHLKKPGGAKCYSITEISELMVDLMDANDTVPDFYENIHHLELTLDMYIPRMSKEIHRKSVSRIVHSNVYSNSEVLRSDLRSVDTSSLQSKISTYLSERTGLDQRGSVAGGTNTTLNSIIEELTLLEIMSNPDSSNLREECRKLKGILLDWETLIRNREILRKFILNLLMRERSNSPSKDSPRKNDSPGKNPRKNDSPQTMRTPRNNFDHIPRKNSSPRKNDSTRESAAEGSNSLKVEGGPRGNGRTNIQTFGDNIDVFAMNDSCSSIDSSKTTIDDLDISIETLLPHIAKNSPPLGTRNDVRNDVSSRPGRIKENAVGDPYEDQKNPRNLRSETTVLERKLLGPIQSPKTPTTTARKCVVTGMLNQNYKTYGTSGGLNYSEGGSSPLKSESGKTNIVVSLSPGKSPPRNSYDANESSTHVTNGSSTHDTNESSTFGGCNQFSDDMHRGPGSTSSLINLNPHSPQSVSVSPTSPLAPLMGGGYRGHGYGSSPIISNRSGGNSGRNSSHPSHHSQQHSQPRRDSEPKSYRCSLASHHESHHASHSSQQSGRSSPYKIAPDLLFRNENETSSPCKASPRSSAKSDFKSNRLSHYKGLQSHKCKSPAPSPCKSPFPCKSPASFPCKSPFPGKSPFPCKSPASFPCKSPSPFPCKSPSPFPCKSPAHSRFSSPMSWHNQDLGPSRRSKRTGGSYYPDNDPYSDEDDIDSSEYAAEDGIIYPFGRGHHNHVGENDDSEISRTSKFGFFKKIWTSMSSVLSSMFFTESLTQSGNHLQERTYQTELGGAGYLEAICIIPIKQFMQRNGNLLRTIGFLVFFIVSCLLLLFGVIGLYKGVEEVEFLGKSYGKSYYDKLSNKLSTGVHNEMASWSAWWHNRPPPGATTSSHHHKAAVHSSDSGRYGYHRTNHLGLRGGYENSFVVTSIDMNHNLDKRTDGIRQNGDQNADIRNEGDSAHHNILDDGGNAGNDDFANDNGESEARSFIQPTHRNQGANYRPAKHEAVVLNDEKDET